MSASEKHTSTHETPKPPKRRLEESEKHITLLSKRGRWRGKEEGEERKKNTEEIVALLLLLCVLVQAKLITH